MNNRWFLDKEDNEDFSTETKLAIQIHCGCCLFLFPILRMGSALLYILTFLGAFLRDVYLFLYWGNTLLVNREQLQKIHSNLGQGECRWFHRKPIGVHSWQMQRASTDSFFLNWFVSLFISCSPYRGTIGACVKASFGIRREFCLTFPFRIQTIDPWLCIWHLACEPVSFTPTPT